MRDLTGLPGVVTRRAMPPWSLTRDHLRVAARDNLLRLARFLGFRSPEGWPERKVARRVFRVVRPDRKQIVKERHLGKARRQDLERLARSLGLHPRASWSREKLERRVWRLVDARAPVEVASQHG